MKTAVITTTINVPYNLREWGAQLDPATDVIVVAGDRKTPHAGVRDLLDELAVETRYLAPDDQVRWHSSDPTGWNCIQRRNIALLEALTFMPDVIITVDDDNHPVSFGHVDVVRDVLDGRRRHAQTVLSDTGWYNVGLALSPAVTCRGYPLSRRHEKAEADVLELPHARVGVLASLWLGDPDIDAIERVCCDPYVASMPGPDLPLAPGTWCPFNSQATAYRRELAPLMQVWPGVGRYDDIWASYLAQQVMGYLGWVVRFGRPLVRQDRNPHDLVRDLEQEMHGYRWTDEVITALRDVRFSQEDVLGCLAECYTQLQPLEAVPRQTWEAWHAWLRDLEVLGSEYEVSFP